MKLDLKEWIAKMLSNTLMRDDITTEWKAVTVSRTIPANTTGYVDVNITKSGYTPLGIIEFSGSGTGRLSWADWYLTSNYTVARLYYFNNTSGSTTLNSLGVTVLYKKVGGVVRKLLKALKPLTLERGWAV